MPNVSKRSLREPSIKERFDGWLEQTLTFCLFLIAMCAIIVLHVSGQIGEDVNQSNEEY
jgi:hypothetical protein